MKKVLAVSIVLLLPGAGFAQTGNAPVIPLAAPPATAQPAPLPDASPGVVGDVPYIALAPAMQQAPALQPPENRDAGQLTGGQQTLDAPADWLLPLMPAQRDLPDQVGIGASLITHTQLRLTGEVARADFVVTLPQGVPVPRAITLALRSSVNVLPKTSYLDVTVNGVDAGRITLDNLAGFAEKLVLTSDLVAGPNRITLSAVHNHRIYCGPEASFAVWTEVDLAASGAHVAPADVPMNADGFLSALRAQAARGAAVEILVEDLSDTVLGSQIAGRIVETIGGATPVAMRSFYSPDAGEGARARVALIAAPQPRVSVRRGAGGALVLQIEHEPNSLPDLDAYFPAQPDGWDTPTLTPGRVTTLADLGVDMVVAETRYFRRDVKFLLPNDWLFLASQKANFNLHYGFSADLPKGALLLIKINGQTVRLLPLDRDGGDVNPPLDINFAASLLNPGINALTFEMSVPGDPPDLPCTPRDTDMLVVLGDSTLNVPPSPKMRQPGIADALALLDGADVTTPDALTDAARNAQTRLAFGAVFRPLSADGGGATLHVVGIEGAGMVPTGTTGVTRRLLQNVVYPILDAAPEPTIAASAPPRPAAGYSLLRADGQANDNSTDPGNQSAGQDGQTSLSRSVMSWLPRSLGGEIDFSITGNTPLETWLSDKSGQALLLQLDPKAPDEVWLIMAPSVSVSDLAAQVDRFRRTPRPDAHEQAALLLADGTWATWSERRAPILLEALTPGNLRPVLGNYASWSPLLFTGLTLIFALMSILPALLFVLMTRRSGSRI